MSGPKEIMLMTASIKGASNEHKVHWCNLAAGETYIKTNQNNAMHFQYRQHNYCYPYKINFFPAEQNIHNCIPLNKSVRIILPRGSFPRKISRLCTFHLDYSKDCIQVLIPLQH